MSGKRVVVFGAMSGGRTGDFFDSIEFLCKFERNIINR